MFELPPDLPRLRVLEAWGHVYLRSIQEAIKAAEERERAEARKTPIPRPSAPPAPAAWVVDRSIGNLPPVVHGAEDCFARADDFGTRPTTPEAARRALTDGSVTACVVCRPDTALGIVD
ncbi:DUF6233 domain-containing protein [Streptomyces beijiangensis]|uniref:Uncharacterized protein n=1 Tax=Streptomyces beijiangensis TaxID=163361 RepID=A0A939JHS3_9ACTN|nr:DUF6233 domain-containing protein [Streptomyces beijiangensis]MBO0512420.1 hypothetical protein [Streptomyces beijiangensis]